MAVHDYIFNKEFLFVTFNFQEKMKWQTGQINSFIINCFNRYYKNTTETWLSIHCNVGEETSCFQEIDEIATAISLLNKYFWNRITTWVSQK